MLKFPHCEKQLISLVKNMCVVGNTNIQEQANRKLGDLKLLSCQTPKTKNWHVNNHYSFEQIKKKRWSESQCSPFLWFYCSLEFMEWMKWLLGKSISLPLFPLFIYQTIVILTCGCFVTIDHLMKRHLRTI